MEKKTAGRRKVEPGPTAGRVAANLRRLRDGLTLSQLSERLTKMGRPILPSGLSKIEQGDRSVDVDDLMALAVALGVAPNRLLLTGTADEGTPVALTETVRAREGAAWWWATGEEPLRTWDAAPRVPTPADFGRVSRPHDPPDTATLNDLLKLEADGRLDDLRRGYAEARAAGLAPKSIVNYLRLQERRHSVDELNEVGRGLLGPRWEPISGGSDQADS
jgi:transcriptional regulator with XRE-family HTH domain